MGKLYVFAKSARKMATTNSWDGFWHIKGSRGKITGQNKFLKTVVRQCMGELQD